MASVENIAFQTIKALQAASNIMLFQGSVQIAKALASGYVNLSFKGRARTPDEVELKANADYIHAALGVLIAYEFFGEHLSIRLLVETMARATNKKSLVVVLKPHVIQGIYAELRHPEDFEKLLPHWMSPIIEPKHIAKARDLML